MAAAVTNMGYGTVRDATDLDLGPWTIELVAKCQFCCQMCFLMGVRCMTGHTKNGHTNSQQNCPQTLDDVGRCNFLVLANTLALFENLDSCLDP